MPEYVYHHIRDSNRGYPYVFTIAPSPWPTRLSNFDRRTRIVAEVIHFVEDQFGIDERRWMYSPDSDIFRFSNERDAFVFRMRWA